jgi:hypothetical protein
LRGVVLRERLDREGCGWGVSRQVVLVLFAEQPGETGGGGIEGRLEEVALEQGQQKARIWQLGEGPSKWRLGAGEAEQRIGRGWQ